MKRDAKKEYDIFISYRRDGGESTAKILRDKLTELGYSVFFDVESLRSGDFNKKLYSVIEECDDFLLILSPGALDRCVNEDDWVRLEIEHAIKNGKNIIPVMLRGYEFPSQLPPSINDIRYKNGIESNYQFFDAFIERLQGFLQSEPSGEKHFFHGLKPLAVAAIALLAAVLFAAIIFGKGLLQRSYPLTKEEKNLVGDLIYYAELNLATMDTAAGYMSDVYKECEAYLAHYDTASEEAMDAEIGKTRQLIYGISITGPMDEDFKNRLMDSPFSTADAAALSDYTISFIDEAIDDLNYVEFLLDRDTYLDLTVREELLECYISIMDEKLKILAYGVNQLFLPVEAEEVIHDFKYDFLPELYHIPLRASNWIDDEDALVSAQESCLNSIENYTDRIILNIGDMNLEVMEQKSALANGTEGLETDLDHMPPEARKVYDPLEDDDAATLWGKMMRFLNLGLYDEAERCIVMLMENAAGTDPYAEDYCTAMIRFIKAIPDTGIDYGLIVVGFDYEAEAHDQYRIGDVIIALNGSQTRNIEEYEREKQKLPEGENYKVTVIRADDGNGSLKELELTLPYYAPRVMIREISEKNY